MSSPAFFRLRSLLARLRADSADTAEGTGRAGETDIAGETDSAGETPAVAGTSGAGGTVGTRDDPIRSLEEAVQAGLDEVRQYLGVLRRQNIAMSIKVARTERRLEDLSAKLEALGCQPEAPGEE
jgi:hypothetical protein